MTRTDIHRPSFADPAEYTEVGFVDNHPEFGSTYRDHDLIGDASEFPGNYTTRGRCDHCGAGPLRYAIEFLHAPSNQTVMVGFACAGKLNLSSRTEVEIRRILEQKRIEQKQVEWLAASEDHRTVKAFLETQVAAGRLGYDGFYHSLLHKLNRYGDLTENQVAAALKAKTREDEFQAKKDAEPQPETPLVEGRREITGTIVSTKFVDSDFGGALKMLVVEDDLNKVWGTVPGNIETLSISHLTHDNPDNFSEVTFHEGIELKGQRITFKATVERSHDDEHFGFFKRPTGAELTEGKE